MSMLHDFHTSVVDPIYWAIDIRRKKFLTEWENNASFMHGIRLRKIPVLKSTVVVIKKGQTREKSALIELRLVLKCFFFPESL